LTRNAVIAFGVELIELMMLFSCIRFFSSNFHRLRFCRSLTCCMCVFVRVHNFVPKRYITNIEVDVSTVNKEETFDDHPSLPSVCSIPVVNLRGDVLDSSPFPLHDRASCPSDFEELPVWIFFPYGCVLFVERFLYPFVIFCL